MISYKLAKTLSNDVRREADKNHLVNIINRSKKNTIRTRLAELACRFGLISA